MIRGPAWRPVPAPAGEPSPTESMTPEQLLQRTARALARELPHTINAAVVAEDQRTRFGASVIGISPVDLAHAVIDIWNDSETCLR